MFPTPHAAWPRPFAYSSLLDRARFRNHNTVYHGDGNFTQPIIGDQVNVFQPSLLAQMANQTMHYPSPYSSCCCRNRSVHALARHGNDSDPVTCVGPNLITYPGFSTQPIIIRDKTYYIRRSFLEEQPYFIANLDDLAGQVSRDALPDAVIGMLIDWINHERCNTDNLLHLVKLNLLAANLRIRSITTWSLGEIQKWHFSDIHPDQLRSIIIAFAMSPARQDGLQRWIREGLAENGGAYLDWLEHDAELRENMAAYPQLEELLDRIF